MNGKSRPPPNSCRSSAIGSLDDLTSLLQYKLLKQGCERQGFILAHFDRVAVRITRFDVDAAINPNSDAVHRFMELSHAALRIDLC